MLSFEWIKETSFLQQRQFTPVEPPEIPVGVLSHANELVI